MADMKPDANVDWKPTTAEPDCEVHDLWVNGRIVEYDVHVSEREDALRRARLI